MSKLKTLSLGIVAGLLLLTLLLLSFNTTAAQDGPEATVTPSGYGDLLDTEIRGLSPEEIADYRNGKGLGMALPAELNGYPGPSHVLGLAEELELTDEQEAEIQALYDEMLPQAITLGEEILAKEAKLELDFREGTITDASLEQQLNDVGELYAQLRFVHLSTHLETITILSQHQIRLYNQFRGYDESSTDGASHDTSSHDH